MSTYKVVAAIWEDHTVYQGMELPKKLDGFIQPSLTVGILYKETDRYLIIISHVERHEFSDQCDYTIILKSSLLGALKEYGTIELKRLRK
jgi:hypothetical protein